MSCPLSTLKDWCVYLKDDPVSVLSFEFFLLTKRQRPNGGAIILIRAFFSAVLLYLLAIGFYEYTSAPSRFKFSCTAFIGAVHDHFLWFGAIFAAMYTGLYARFASQWSYLANLYNQIKDAEIKAIASLADKSPSSELQQKLAEWKAGYVEDAENLHLATKRSFAPVIYFWLSDDQVKQAYICATPNGKERFESLQKTVQQVVKRFGGISRYDTPEPHSEGGAK